MYMYMYIHYTNAYHIVSCNIYDFFFDWEYVGFGWRKNTLLIWRKIWTPSLRFRTIHLMILKLTHITIHLMMLMLMHITIHLMMMHINFKTIHLRMLRPTRINLRISHLGHHRSILTSKISNSAKSMVLVLIPRSSSFFFLIILGLASFFLPLIIDMIIWIMSGDFCVVQFICIIDLHDILVWSFLLTLNLTFLMLYDVTRLSEQRRKTRELCMPWRSWKRNSLLTKIKLLM